jgi:hypothetical protein
LNKEIGSEFWIDNYNTNETNSGIPLWLNKFGNIVLTSSGRGAISLALSQFKPKIKKALLPLYICDSVIMPFEYAGYEIIYYELDEYFTPQIKDKENIDIGVFLHMGYFGFPTNENLVKFVSRLKSKAVVVIEDVTHNVFSSYSRVIDSDFIVGSIRKWFGVPSGGFLSSSNNIKVQLENHPGAFIELRTNGLLKKFEYMESMDISLKEEYLQNFREAEELLDKDIHSYRIDKTSQKIINSLNSKNLINSRIENYKILSKNLQYIDDIKIIFEKLDNNVCPMFFPIYVKGNRDRLRLDLINRKIYCPIHWSIPEQVKGYLDNKTEYIYNSILSIPCDQRYNGDDMWRIISTIEELV